MQVVQNPPVLSAGHKLEGLERREELGAVTKIRTIEHVARRAEIPRDSQRRRQTDHDGAMGIWRLFRRFGTPWRVVSGYESSGRSRWRDPVRARAGEEEHWELTSLLHQVSNYPMASRAVPCPSRTRSQSTASERAHLLVATSCTSTPGSEFLKTSGPSKSSSAQFLSSASLKELF